VGDGNHTIRKISADGMKKTWRGVGYRKPEISNSAFFLGFFVIFFYIGRVTTIAGTGEKGYVDGPARLAKFRDLTSIAISNGVAYVVDNDALRKLTLV
jgi:hypothetical protein